MPPIKRQTQIDFCLPVYNEEKILRPNALKLWQWCQENNLPFSWQITIVVNGSTDQSFNIARALAEKYQQIKAVNIAAPGRGQALKKYWLTSQADILAYMDIDLAVSLDNISALIQPILQGKADLVIGSRLLPESKIERSTVRELSSQGYNFLSRLILGHRFSDLQCGFKAVRADTFQKISSLTKDEKWFFDTELIMFAHWSGAKVREIPVDWSENRYDQRQSKVKVIKDSFKFFINLLKLKIKLRKLNASSKQLQKIHKQ